MVMPLAFLISIPTGVGLDYVEKAQRIGLSVGLTSLCSRLESNQHRILRKDISYPLNDGSGRTENNAKLAVERAFI